MKMDVKDHIIVPLLIFTVIFSPVCVISQDPNDYFGQEEADYYEYYDGNTDVLNNYTNPDIASVNDNKNALSNVLKEYNPEFNEQLQGLQNGMDAIAHILKDIAGKLGCENRGLCSPPFKKVITGECLHINTEKRKTWQDARETCQSMGADLAEPVSIRHNLDYITRLSATVMIRMGQYEFWVGASDHKKEGTWEWVSGNPVADDINWTSDHPSDTTGREDCMAMIYKHPPAVYAQNCLTRKYFVCQKYI